MHPTALPGRELGQAALEGIQAFSASPAHPRGPVGCPLRAGNPHSHFICQSQGGQEPIPLPRRPAQLRAH